MPSRNITRTILKDRSLAPKKKLGQNFLVNENLIEQILDHAAPKSDDTIIEFGVGLGALTTPLARRVKRVIGLEVDAGIVAWHKDKPNLPENVNLIHEDILKCDFRELSKSAGGNLKIIANLPYSISNPLIFKLIEHADIVESAVLMLQKEVGQRLAASSGTKEYGVLSVLLGSTAEVRTLMTLGPQHFHPKPKIDSVVVKITFMPQSQRVKELPPHNYHTLKKIVKGAFQQRRKTLLNALSSINWPKANKDVVRLVLESAGIQPNRRPDNLTIEEYVSLSCQFDNYLR